MPLTVNSFIDKWRASVASERSNYALFPADLAAVLGVPPPDPATGSPKRDAEAPTFAAVVLTRLVALNAERAGEEARGLVRYLHPSFQNPAPATRPRST